MQAWNIANHPSGVIYVGRSALGQYDLEVATGGTLTIQEGITVKFRTTASDLRITGTGVLNASGSSSNLITFTKDLQANWGHISFEASTGTSILNYCIIENGLKTGAGIEGFGGGIHANTSNLVVSNSIVRNNYATYGGGIFVNKTQNPSISNCIINNNIASFGGGGLYFWNTSSSVVTNCLIYNNSVTSTTLYGGGGILFGPSTGSVKVINCTLAHNTAGFKANEIYFYSSPNARVLNSILWGSNLPYFGTTSSSFVNCAIQGGFPSGSVGCINLNSLNSDVTGPNFVATDGSDWSITFISPCRDAGVNSYTGVTIPALDYIGNPTIFNKDIGAYEVQYNRWKTTPTGDITSWTDAGNWEQGVFPGKTGSTRDVIIPKLTGSSVAPDISGITTLGSGKYLILEPGAKATLTTISNSGTLWLMSNSTDIFSLKVDNYSNNGGTGTEKIELYLPGKELLSVNNWHYISSPVSSLPVSTFSPVPTQNLAQFVESLPSGGYYDGWIAYDGFNYTLGTVPPNPPYTFSSLAVGQGYNYFHKVNYKYTFSGNLNTSDVSKTLSYTGTPGLAIRGFNLIGNPFTSGLNWDVIANGTYPSNTSKAIHFTKNNLQCDYVNGVGTNGATGIIPPMQGFFIKTGNTPDINLTIPTAARVHDAIHARYKGETILPLVRLSITEDSISDETVVRFDDLAKSYLDNDFDAVKMFVSESNTTIYSSLDGTKYAINGLPFPATFVEIPVVVTFTTSGEHTISTAQLQGMTDYFVTLTDKVTGFSADLKTNPNVVFSANAGSYPDRFVLKISNLTTGTEDLPVSKNMFSIYHANDMINIQTMSEDWEGKTGSVRILDLGGKIITDQQNAEFRKSSIIQISSPSVKGLYVVEIRSGMKRYVGKVMIR